MNNAADIFSAWLAEGSTPDLQRQAEDLVAQMLGEADSAVGFSCTSKADASSEAPLIELLARQNLAA